MSVKRGWEIIESKRFSFVFPETHYRFEVFAHEVVKVKIPCRCSVQIRERYECSYLTFSAIAISVDEPSSIFIPQWLGLFYVFVDFVL